MRLLVKIVVGVLALNIVLSALYYVAKAMNPAKPNTLTAAQQAKLAAISSATSAAATATAGGASTSVPRGAATRTYALLPFLDSPGNTISTTPVSGIAACNTLCDNTPGCVGTSYAAGKVAQTLLPNATSAAGPGSCLLKAQIASVPYSTGTTLSVPAGDFSTTFSNTIANGSSITVGQPLVSPGGKAALVIGADNNMNLYALSTGTVVMSSSTSGKGVAPASLQMQNDNNLVLYDAKGTALWASNTNSGTQGTLSAVLADTAFTVQDGAGRASYSTRFTAA